MFYFSSWQYLRHLFQRVSWYLDMTATKWFGNKGGFLIYRLINSSINYSFFDLLIFKKLQIWMKQWWFRYVIRQLIEKLIIYDFFFYYSAINQSIIVHCSLPIPTMCCKVASLGAEGAQVMSCARGLLFIYLAWGGVLWMYC